MIITWRDIVIQRLVRSKYARKYYKLAPQRRPVGTIDLNEIKSKDELYKYWMEIVGLTGNFSLLARNSKGMLEKCVAIMRVSRNGITFKDERCALAVRLRKLSEKRLRDLEI